MRYYETCLIKIEPSIMEGIIHEEPDVFREAEYVATMYYPLHEI